ncbi:MAG: cellulase family glycosylhydrolase, partial [Candidatus Methylomirabilis sp.]|nr:cellulase family glycosylhydrolase [Deltaproteobacteria bacterium]
PWAEEVTELTPLYEDAAAVIRANDPSAILFLCPRTAASAGAPSFLPKPTYDNFAYAPHFYDALVAVLGFWLGNPTDQAFARMAAKAAEWDAPWLLGEFGAPGPGGNARGYVDHLYSRLNATLASGTQWVYTPGWTEAAKDGWNLEDFSIVDGMGATRPNFRVRPFPRRTAGEPTKLSVRDPQGAVQAGLDYRWEHDPALGATEIFAPKDLFRAGAPVVKAEGVSCAYDGAGSLLTCASESAGAKRVLVRSCEPRWGECD